jgi:uncharacterized membrane protein
MSGIKDLFASERGLFGLLLVISATTLTGLGQMTVVQWQDFSMWIFGIYVGGKSLTGAVGLFKGTLTAPEVVAPAAAPAAPVAPAAPATP